MRLGECLGLLASVFASSAFAAQASVEDCLKPELSTVIEANVGGNLTQARAVWLDDQRIRWPGKSAELHFRLYASRLGRIEARLGKPVLGADQAFDLEVVTSLPADETRARFRYLGEGAELALRGINREQLGELLRGELVLAALDPSGVLKDVTLLQDAAALDARYADAAERIRLGVQPTRSATDFALWAPTAQQVSLCLYAKDNAEAAEVLPSQRDEASGVWSHHSKGDLSNRAYTWLVDVFVPGLGIVRNRVTDPYSISLDADSRRSWIGSLDAADMKPAAWDAARGPEPAAGATDMQIYELHLRDFSASDESVPSAHRGKFLAFADRESNGMRHLRALAAAGITDVHLLPVFDIATIPETGCLSPKPEGAADSESQASLIAATHDRDCYNWGYEPLHYTAPEGSYASDPGDGRVRVREFRRMVQGLHAAGLRVGMDVVYNHTSASGQDAKSVLDRIVPGYYHRLDANGIIERSTCCANTATEQRMMAKLMRDSVATWAREYHLDSFRFDLMGHQPRAAMEAVQVAADAARGHHVVLIGEGWNFGEVADGARFVQASQRSLNGSGIATFSDRARDAVRGGGCCDTGVDLFARQGYVNGLFYAPNAHAIDRASRDDLVRSADLVRVGLAGTLRDFKLQTGDGSIQPLSKIDYAGQPAGYASAPGEVVNYVENHDNLTLFDTNLLKLPLETPIAERARVQILGAAITAFSQGVAYWHAGIESLRSKSLDRNSYDSGDWFNAIDWRFRDNGFGRGLPSKADNGKDWPMLRPLLANAALKPDAAAIRWTRDAFLDLLRIRASSSLLRLRNAEQVMGRLHFLNTGPDQIATLLVEHLDGQHLAGAGFAELMVFVNVDTQATEFNAERAGSKPWQLHPIQRNAHAADTRVRSEARYDSDHQRFHIPARSAVVFVIDANGETE